MSPQNPNQGGASRGPTNPEQSNPGAERESQKGSRGRDPRDPKQTPHTEPTHPTSSQSGGSQSGSSQSNPSAAERGREGGPGPRFDDRPEPREPDRDAVSREENEGSAGSTTRRSDERDVKPSSGLPGYGDREPGDPRRVEVEGREERE